MIPVKQVAAHLLELGAGDVLLDVLGAVCGGGDEGQRDAGLRDGAQLHLGLLSSLCQTLQSLQGKGFHSQQHVQRGAHT